VELCFGGPKELGLSQEDEHSLGTNREGESRGLLANPGSSGY